MPMEALLIFLRGQLAHFLLNNGRLPHVPEATIRNDSFALPGIGH